MKTLAFLLATAVSIQPVLLKANTPSPYQGFPKEVYDASYTLEHTPTAGEIDAFSNDHVLDVYGYPKNNVKRTYLKSLIRSKQWTGKIGKVASIIGGSIAGAGAIGVIAFSSAATAIAAAIAAGHLIAPEVTADFLNRAARIATVSTQYFVVAGTTGVLSFYLSGKLSKQARAQIFYDILKQQIPEVDKLKWTQYDRGVTFAHIEINQKPYYLIHSDKNVGELDFLAFLQNQNKLDFVEKLRFYSLTDVNGGQRTEFPRTGELTVEEELLEEFTLSEIVDTHPVLSLDKNSNYVIELISELNESN